MKKLLHQELNENWNILNEDRNIQIKTQIPTTIFEALISQKIIDDPFYGNNEHKMGWVYNSQWQYQLKFDVNPDIMKKERVILKFEGLDTICDIFLNNKKIASTENMFRTYEFEVKSKLKSRNNKLSIVFKSPTKEAGKLIEKHGVKLNTFDGLKGVPYLRKAQYSFGWDWGPKLPDIGIWKPISLIGLDIIRLDSVYSQQFFTYSQDPELIQNKPDLSQLDVEKVEIDIKTELEIINKDHINIDDLNLKLRAECISPQGKNVFENTIPLSSDAHDFSFTLQSPQLWWTHDLGGQALYKIKLQILKGSGKILQEIEKAIGIREVKLIRRDDEWGRSFYFRLNGIPLFAKGGNWIPVDQFIPRGKKLGLYELNLKYSKMANMNFIRVWGGGIYEDDLFYELCDEMGMLVWQDFPFACSIYPFHEKFFENVKAEAIQNIKRLRHHASLALWCGNNEVESIWFGYLFLANVFWKPWKKRKFRKAYFRIFEEMLPQMVKKYDPGRSSEYWPSSPSNGIGKKKLRFIDFVKNQLFPKANKGDSHFWKVWHMGAPFSSYREFDSRFMSEFGFESFPSMKTIHSFAPENAFEFYSDIMENHQKNSAGNKKIMKYMKKRFSIPDGFEERVILSQITQAEAIEYGVEHWRRNRNKQHCMGSLYWQINDCWPVASWASLDYYCRWKALHYFAKRFYLPLFASIMESDDRAEFWITNDFNEVKEGTYIWYLINSDGEVLEKKDIEYRVDPCKSKMIDSISLEDYPSIAKATEKHILFFKMSFEGSEDQYGFRLFGDPKDFPLDNPNITSEFLNSEDVPQKYRLKSKISEDEQKSEENLWLKIFSKNVALFVFLESEEVDFLASDNYFAMRPGQSRIIKLSPLKTTQDSFVKEEDEFRKAMEKSLRVRSLFDLV